MGSPRIPFEPGACYHIYNHAVGKEDVFREEENYTFFLRKVSARIMPFADVLAYCLMGNHFHFVLRIKSHEELLDLWKSKIEKKKVKTNVYEQGVFLNSVFDELIIHEFAVMFNSYAQSYNRKYFRQGALMKESFQRKRIDDSEYLLKLICYVHNNPVNHGFVGKPEDWMFSSFKATLSGASTKVRRDDVLEMFGGRENFIFVHKQNIGGEI